jgi:hypothetical protein
MSEEYRGAQFRQISPEEMDEQQYLQEKGEFESWFHGAEIQGDYKEACKKLGLNPNADHDLFEAYFKPKIEDKK